MNYAGQYLYSFFCCRVSPALTGSVHSKRLSSFIFALPLLIMISFIFSKGQAVAGIVEGQLSPCPDTPNCVCSEDSASSAYIEPLRFSDSSDTAWAKLKQLVVSSGGIIHVDERPYLLTSYTTKWLRFVDDVEFRMDADNRLIHVRSASRVGRSDFGVNRKRVEMLRALFNKKPISQ